MGRESCEVWTKRVERWRDSGLSATEFAAEIGVNANSLRHWGWRVNAERSRAESKPSAMEAKALTWVEVSAPEPAPTRLLPSAPAEKIELVLASGLVVRVPANFEPEGLRITRSAEQGNLGTVGLATRFRVIGDFEITAGYELLSADQPMDQKII